MSFSKSYYNRLEPNQKSKSFLWYICTIRSTIHWELSTVFPDYYKHSLSDNYELRLRSADKDNCSEQWEKKTIALVHNAVLGGLIKCVTQ